MTIHFIFGCAPRRTSSRATLSAARTTPHRYCATLPRGACAHVCACIGTKAPRCAKQCEQAGTLSSDLLVETVRLLADRSESLRPSATEHCDGGNSAARTRRRLSSRPLSLVGMATPPCQDLSNANPNATPEDGLSVMTSAHEMLERLIVEGLLSTFAIEQVPSKHVRQWASVRRHDLQDVVRRRTMSRRPAQGFCGGTMARKAASHQLVHKSPRAFAADPTQPRLLRTVRSHARLLWTAPSGNP